MSNFLPAEASLEKLQATQDALYESSCTHHDTIEHTDYMLNTLITLWTLTETNYLTLNLMSQDRRGAGAR